MALRLLPNSAGNTATTADTTGVGSTKTGYDVKDLITGPRSRMYWCGSTSGTHTTRYSHSSALDYDHVVIARADLLANNETAVKLVISDFGSSNVKTYDPLATSDLIGIDVAGRGYGQDLVYDNVTSRGFSIVNVSTEKSSGGDDMSRKYSKVYFSEAFHFGKEPTTSPAPNWQPVSDSDRMFRPYRGNFEYDTEAVITLTWRKITQAKLDAFKALPQILNWPLFLYDTTGDVWEHQLEHVLVQTWQEVYVRPGYFDLSITFRRLAHYL